LYWEFNIDLAISEMTTPVTTGLEGLDYILRGGFGANQAHLIEGLPGTGKTTLALQFLIEGRDRGDAGLFVCTAETRDEICNIAASHGLSLDGIDIFELFPTEPAGHHSFDQSIFHTADLELGETIALLTERVIAQNPRRVVVSEFSEIRLLAEEPRPYRQKIRTLLQFFTGQSCTVLLLESLMANGDIYLQNLANSVLRLEQLTLPYGGERRRMRVSKMRGRAFRGGYHDFVIREGGLRIFPRLVSTDHPPATVAGAPVTTGIAALDALLGGGIQLGTTTVIRGPSGGGKSALALQPLNAALARGEKAMFITFDETVTNFVRRSHALGLPTKTLLDVGTLRFMRVDPAELSPGEFADTVCREILGGVTAIVIDSVSGYQHAVPAENNLLLHLHELLKFLNEQGVLTVLVVADGAEEGGLNSPYYLTYLADTVVEIRFVQSGSGQKRAVFVTKTRTGGHEPGARELFFDQSGIHVGPTIPGSINQSAMPPVDRWHVDPIIETSPVDTE